jgi:hypothetical protein
MKRGKEKRDHRALSRVWRLEKIARKGILGISFVHGNKRAKRTQQKKYACTGGHTD